MLDNTFLGVGRSCFAIVDINIDHGDGDRSVELGPSHAGMHIS